MVPTLRVNKVFLSQAQFSWTTIDFAFEVLKIRAVLSL